MLLAHFISTKLVADPLVTAVIVILLATFLLVLNYIITQGFERLAEVAQMRADFINIVSHQLRAPLTNIRWTIDAFSRNQKKSQEGQFEYLEILRENSARMTELVSDLLIVLRIEEGRLPFKKEWFSLPEVVKEIIKDFIPLVQAHNVRIGLTVPKNFPSAWSDPQQIKRVIENLLTNAIQYTKEGGEIKVVLSRQGIKILCQIKDTGIGIPQASQKYVFKKFFRAGNAKKLQTQGSGLGLFIAKSVIEKAGGKIGFQSQENKGSTFWFSLPIK